MTSFKCLQFLLFLSFLCLVCCEEPDHVFRAKGHIIEMGYCFGVDYIVVYRIGPEGEQLLGNSSANSTVQPPADLQDRVHPTLRDQLLGMHIVNLTCTDSGIYRRECWEDHNLVSQFTQHLFVCDEMVQSKEIVVKKGADGAEFLCNDTSAGLEGTSVHWYYEMYPTYRPILFLDSDVSLEPLEEEFKGGMEVKQGGALLMIKNNVLKNIQHFHCLVFKGKNCLSFQNIYVPSNPENKEIFATAGDDVVLNCPSDGKHQQWETPLGTINGDSERQDEMYLSQGEKMEDFSLVLPKVSDELSGDYSCVSTSLEIQYLLVLCPTNPTQNKSLEGGDFSLTCGDGQDDSLRVKWYYRDTTGEYVPIHDSNNIPILEHLIGRADLSNNGSSLTVTNVDKTDAGLYRCVVLRLPKEPEPETEGEYEYDYEEEQTEDDDDEYEPEEFNTDEALCVVKQDTSLTIIKPVTRGPGTKRGNSPTQPDQGQNSNTTATAAGAAAVGVLVVVGAAIAAFVFWRKKSRSGQSKDKDIHMQKQKQEDPACSERLTTDCA